MKFSKDKSTARQRLCLWGYILGVIMVSLFCAVITPTISLADQTNVKESLISDINDSSFITISENNTEACETGFDAFETFINSNVETTTEKMEVIETAIVVTDKVKVTSKPGGPDILTGTLLGVLREDDLVNIVSKTEYGWYQIEYDNSYGYVFGLHLEIIDIIQGLENTTEPEDTTVEPYKNIQPKEEDVETTTTIDIDEYQSTDVLGSDNISYDELYQTIEIIAPELISITDALLENYERYGLKPSFQLAVFCLESGYGTSDLAVYKNNLCGFNAYATSTETVYQHASSFSTKSECTLAFGDLINNSYVSNGRSSIESISTKYCPPNAQNWTKLVRNIQSKIESTYNSLSV